MKMMIVVTSVAVMLAGLNMTGAQEARPPSKDASVPVLRKQTACPVMGGAVNTNLYVDYNGKRIYVCCNECMETVRKDPTKYIRALEAGGVTLEKAQTTCPVMGGKIDKKVFADYNGKRVYFCCAGCIPQFKQEPGKYLEKLEAEGIAPENIPAAADTEKKEASKDTSAQVAPKAELKDAGGSH